jgi:alpha-amylase
MSSQQDNTPARNIVLYFQVHQPRRLRPFRFFDIGTNIDYFDESHNSEIVRRVARRSYLPTNALLLKLIKKYPQLKITFSISGVALDQFREYAPEVLDSFRELAATSSVELLGETDQHSLACLIPGEEFEMQVLDHAAKLYEYFGLRPTVFRNTELIYNNEIAQRVEALGFNGIFTDGIEKILGNRSPHHLYETPNKGMKVFLRNYRLSDDIAFRFTHKGQVLTLEKYMSWLNGIPPNEELITLAMDYETFGEHQRDQGIMLFLEGLLTSLAAHKNFRTVTPTEAIAFLQPAGIVDVPHHISWADNERDLSAWLGNDMQCDAFDTLLKLEPEVRRLEDPKILERWRWLQTSDHFYYMSTKKDDDGNVHAYFSPYNSPYEAFINYINVLHDFAYQLTEIEKRAKAEPDTASVRAEAERREVHMPQWAMKLPRSYDERR